MKVTRIAYSRGLNAGKYAVLVEQARRLGQVRSQVWQRYGSVNGARLGDRQIRDRWLAAGYQERFGVLANAWKETVRDAVADIRACREAAKVKVRRVIARQVTDPADRKRLFTALKAERWAEDAYLSRLMRQHWRRGKNHTHDQIVVRADQHRSYTLTEGGTVWLAIPGLVRRQMVKIPLNTTVAPTGTLRLILRDGRVEVHYQVDAAGMKSSRPCGDRRIGVDKGYTEVLVDSDGEHHGPNLGRLLTAESDRVKERNRRRAKLRSIANNAARRSDRAKAERIARNNLGTVKRDRQAAKWKAAMRTEVFRAVHAVVDKATLVAAEDLTKPFTARNRGRNTNRRLNAWTKGVTAEALASVSERRGSTLVMVNAAYTSQVDPSTGLLAARAGDRLHCPGGVVWQADHAAAINVLARVGDPDITLHTPHTRVRQILQERADRQRIRLPIQDSSREVDGGERNIHPCSTTSK
ncbi:MAG TPA: zinc ribbon domain-containing protein [Micromonospora sp.]|nr:zinc ribbon domain-containing protein [Micromonospora sp.]